MIDYIEKIRTGNERALLESMLTKNVLERIQTLSDEPVVMLVYKQHVRFFKETIAKYGFKYSAKSTEINRVEFTIKW